MLLKFELNIWTCCLKCTLCISAVIHLNVIRDGCYGRYHIANAVPSWPAQLLSINLFQLLDAKSANALVPYHLQHTLTLQIWFDAEWKPFGVCFLAVASPISPLSRSLEPHHLWYEERCSIHISFTFIGTLRGYTVPYSYTLYTFLPP